MLRIAVPNKGALSEAAAAMLSKAGYRQRSDTKDLVLIDELNNVEFTTCVRVTSRYVERHADLHHWPRHAARLRGQRRRDHGAGLGA